ncbi:MAG: efflux RND transporter periplasmic adaptor subunit [Melioribacteraceae bacterium]|nr:efflux RND transporter periplasmic adaptor subunit [Melioribacteraceae bacterium]
MKLVKYLIVVLLLIGSISFIGCSESEGNTTEKKKEVIKKISVKTIVLKSGKYSDFISVIGTVKPFQKALLSATEGGKITKYLKDKGDYVKKGETILEIDNDILKANLDATKAQFELAEITFQKQEMIYKQNVNSEIQYLQSKYGMEQLKANLSMIQTRYNNTFIVAPFSGYIDYKYYEEGELAPVGQPIINLIDIGKVKIEAGVPENFITLVKKGDMVAVLINAVGKEYTGKISFVGTSVNATNRTFPIEITIFNKEKLLKPELIADVKIQTKSYDKMITIPTEVITRVDNGYVVYVENNGIAEGREVIILKRSGDKVAVSEGLNDGDKLIVVGYQSLIDGQAINVVE